jgi:hypothetical protein
VVYILRGSEVYTLLGEKIKWFYLSSFS